jgi:hypothetical protein
LERSRASQGRPRKGLWLVGAHVLALCRVFGYAVWHGTAGVSGVQVRIRVEGDDGEESRALGRWLGEERELRGRVSVVNGPPGPTELGSVAEVVSVALGADGAGTVLASSLITWLQSRRTRARITVETARQKVTLELATVDDVRPLLEKVLRADDDDGS